MTLNERLVACLLEIAILLILIFDVPQWLTVIGICATAAFAVYLIVRIVLVHRAGRQDKC